MTSLEQRENDGKESENQETDKVHKHASKVLNDIVGFNPHFIKIWILFFNVCEIENGLIDLF